MQEIKHYTKIDVNIFINNYNSIFINKHNNYKEINYNKQGYNN